MVAVIWHWHTECPVYMHTMCQNFSSLPQVVPKLLPKVFIFWLLSRPLLNFLSRPSYCAKYWVIHICHMSGKGKYMYKFPFKTLICNELTHLAVKRKQNAILIISRPSILVSLQQNGRQSACISAHQVWLEGRGPATCICRVERPNWVSPRSIQHQQGYMVCYNCRLSR